MDSSAFVREIRHLIIIPNIKVIETNLTFPSQFKPDISSSQREATHD